MNDRGQYNRSGDQVARQRGITGAPAVAIGVGMFLLVPVLAILIGGAAGLALAGKRG